MDEPDAVWLILDEQADSTPPMQPHALDTQGSPRHPRAYRGRDHFVLDTAAAFKEVGTREIKKVPALARQDTGQFLRRAKHAHAHRFELAAIRLSADVINISATTSSLTKGETLKDTREISRRSTPTSSSCATARAGAPQFLARAARGQRHQCRRRRARASHPGAARYFHDSREARAASPGCTSRSSATFFSAASRARTFMRCSNSAHASRSSARARWCRASSSNSACTVTHRPRRRARRRPTSSICCASSTSVSARNTFPSLGEYTALFGLTKDAREAPQTRLPHHASRARSIAASRSTATSPTARERDSRSGDQRPRRAHGRPLPLRRDRDDRMNDHHPQRPHHRPRERPRSKSATF